MAWKLAPSLVTLRTQLNAAYPNRSKASDGTIGDTAHSSTVSQHNPNTAGYVTAMDITHDPAHGVDGQALADKLILDPRAWYVIFNRRIRYNGGAWQAYNGANPHTKHVHLSTKQNPANYANPDKWNITNPTPPKEETAMTTEHELRLEFRMRLGRLPTAAEYKHYVGAFTTEQVDAYITNYDEYKKIINNSKTGNINVRNFLGQGLRDNWVDSGGAILKPGKYEVK